MAAQQTQSPVRRVGNGEADRASLVAQIRTIWTTIDQLEDLLNSLIVQLALRRGR